MSLPYRAASDRVAHAQVLSLNHSCQRCVPLLKDNSRPRRMLDPSIKTTHWLFRDGPPRLRERHVHLTRRYRKVHSLISAQKVFIATVYGSSTDQAGAKSMINLLTIYKNLIFKHYQYSSTTTD